MAAELADINTRDRELTGIILRMWLSSGGDATDGVFAPSSSHVLVSCMERGRESGTLAATVGVRQAAQLLMDLYIGVLCRWVRADEAFSLRTEFDRMIDLALPGLVHRG
ncbi:hypothetical protein [Nonomuraea helvata]|uniref:TetR family transcriptional regulator n=1 Tax=Nonomuraea helvata TaxID=37484 RepID=A0ABV5S744_9ACTN